MNDAKTEKPWSPAPGGELLKILAARFANHLPRHAGLAWDPVQARLAAHPEKLSALGGALFCDRRFGQVFVYHNGAQSYYRARGFRGWLRV